MYYLGIDLGGTNIAVGIVNENFEIVKKGSTPTLAQRETDEVMKDMGALCVRLMKEAGISYVYMSTYEMAYAFIRTMLGGLQ